MFKKSISLLLALIIIIGSFSALSATVSGAETEAAEQGAYLDIADEGADAGIAEVGAVKLTEKAFVKKLDELRQKYPDKGRFSGVYYENGSAKAWTCHAYVCQLMYEVFGIQFYNGGYFNIRDYEFGTIHAGDLVRIDWNSHSVFITKVKGDKVWYTDANSDNYNGIRWDTELTLDELRNRFTYKFHLDGNTLMGTGADFELETPELVRTENSYGKMTAYWSAVEDAAGYRVYLKNNETGKWSAVADTEELFFELDETVYNTNYTFTVRALNAEGKVASDYDHDGITGRYAYVPQMNAERQVGKTVLSWDEEPTASAYRVFYKGDDIKSWKKLGDTEETSMEFTEGKALTEYTFTLRWLDEEGKYLSDYDKAGFSATFITYDTQLAAPVLTKASTTNSKGCIKISWKAVEGAVGYQVFYIRKDVDNKWRKLGQTEETTYTHTGCVNDKVYKYTVRCIDGDGKYMSGYDKTGVSIHFYDLPGNIKAAAATKQGAVKLSWSSVKGAYGYQTFYKREGIDNGWKKLAKTTGLSVVQTGCSNNTVYTYTVRCIDKKGNYISGYDTDGVSLKYFLYPEKLRAIQWGKDIIVTCGKVSGAYGYVFYYKTADSAAWKRIDRDDISYDHYVLKNCKSGVKYTFTVRACDVNGKLISSYDPKGVSVSFGYKKQDEWTTIYRDFIVNKKYLRVGTEFGFGNTNDAGATSMFLYDLTKDGIPELILSSSTKPDGADPRYVFTIKKDRVVYLGHFNTNNDGIYCNPYSGNNGLFIEAGSKDEGKKYSVYYVYISADAVKTKAVADYTVSSGKVAAAVRDEALYNTYKGAVRNKGGVVPETIYGLNNSYSYRSMKASLWTSFVRAFEH